MTNRQLSTCVCLLFMYWSLWQQYGVEKIYEDNSRQNLSGSAQKHIHDKQFNTVSGPSGDPGLMLWPTL